MTSSRLAPLALLLAACNLAPEPLKDDTAADTAGGGGTGGALADINNGTVVPGTVVTVDGLVVTSGLTREGEGFFVADPAGGPRSGLYVFGGPGLGEMPMAVGDEVSVTGEVQDFYGWTELRITGWDGVTVTGTATVPAPVDLGDGAGVNWEDYESVAVRLTNQSIVGIDSYNTATLSGGVLLDDGFQYLDLTCGGTFDRIDGIVFYSYEHHSVNPRSDADLGTYTGGGGGAVTVADVQAGGTCGGFTLEGVVVTSPSYDKDGKSTFFVQDPVTGAGVAVFTKNGTYAATVGDVISLEGTASEYYDFTEVVVDDVSTIASSGTATPVPAELDAAPSDWEPYEGQLITLTDVTATSEPAYGQVSTNYAGLFLDDLFVRFDVANGDSFGSVTGVLYYSYSEWKLEPRSESDLVR